jgi:DNA replication initiation complex subunit (GINS family)
MGRLRKYESDAARKAAHRARSKAQWVEIDRASYERHTARLEALQRAVQDAAGRGDATAQACTAGSIDTMLEKLTKYFEARR